MVEYSMLDRIVEFTKYTIKISLNNFNVAYQITNKQNGYSYKFEKLNGVFSIDEEVENLKILLGD